MMRLTSLYIEFNKETYLALVSVRQREKEVLCQVRYIDGGLLYELTSELLVFDLNGTVKQTSCLKNVSVGSLMNNTIRAISKHLQAG